MTKLGKILPFGRFFSLGRNLFQELNYYWAIFWAKFYLLRAIFFQVYLLLGDFFRHLGEFFSNRLVTLHPSGTFKYGAGRENWIAKCFHADKKAMLAAPSMGKPGVSARHGNQRKKFQ